MYKRKSIRFKYAFPRHPDLTVVTKAERKYDGATPFDIKPGEKYCKLYNFFTTQEIATITAKRREKATNKFFCLKYNASEKGKAKRKQYGSAWYSKPENRKKHSDYYKARRPYMNEMTRDRLIKRRAMWIERLGGKCRICGKPIDESIDELRAEFHHTVPEKKVYNISDMLTRYDESRIWKEIKEGGVVLVHKKCHRNETNYQLYALSDEEAVEVLKLWNTNMYTREALALRFHCSRSTIDRIVNHETKRDSTIMALL